jgi:regulation of enolase protein 1 (concanavalin A-like superfamily)
MRRAMLVTSVLIASVVALAQQTAGPVLRGLPSTFHWRNNPAVWTAKDGVLTIKAGEKTDWFISPIDGKASANSPIMLFPAATDFSLSSKVTVDFRAQWDAGVLAVYADETHWAKFCFEKTVEQKPAIVSVVTRGLSDDSTAMPIDGNSVYMKIAKSGQAIFLYYSTDGTKWTVVRAFSLGPASQSLQIGFSAQSPVGAGSTTTFTDVQYKPNAVANLWTGE